MALEIALTVCRFAHFATCIFAFGASTFWLALPRDLHAQDDRRALRVALRISAAGTVLTAIVWFLCVAGTMAGDAWSAADPAVLQAVLLNTDFGQIWVWRVLLGLVVAIVTFRAAPEMRLGSATLSGLLLASIALTGHAAMQEGAAGLRHRITDAVHLLSGGYWIGAICALPFLLKAAQRSDSIFRTLCRFSDLGIIAVVLVVTSGLFNAFFIVRDWSHVLQSAYGKVLLVKICLVIVMVIIACINRFVLMPTFREGNAALHRLRQSVIAETVAGGSVVLAASLLGTLSPPM